MSEETKTEEVKTETTEMVEITKADQELAEIIEKNYGRVFDLNTTKGLDDAIGVRAEYKNFRIGLGKTSKDMKSHLNNLKRKIDTETERITAKVKMHEDPIDDIIKARQAEKAEAKRLKDEAEKKRVSDIQDVIHSISGTPDRCRDLGSEALEEVITGIADYEITPFFEEFKEQAEAAVKKALSTLEDMQLAADKREHEDRERKEEAERLDKQKAEQDAAQAIMDAKQAELDTKQAEMDKITARETEEKKPVLEEVQEEKAEPAPVEPTPVADKTSEPTAMRQSVTPRKTLADVRRGNSPEPRSDKPPYVPASMVMSFETDLVALAHKYWVPRSPTAEEFTAWISEHVVDKFNGGS